MSARAFPIRRTTVPVLAAVVMLVIAPAAAVADPPALNRDPCATLLAKAGLWPGGMDTEAGTVRLVSDAFVTYLSSQPPCSSPGA